MHEYIEAERKHGVSMYVSIVWTALPRVPIIQGIALEALQHSIKQCVAQNNH